MMASEVVPPITLEIEYNYNQNNLYSQTDT